MGFPKQEVARRLEERFDDLRFAYVLGSVVTGDARSDSDVDLAVDFGRRLEAEELSSLRQTIAESTRRDVDIADLQRTGPIFDMQVLRKGEVVVAPDSRALKEFQMYTPSRYWNWKRQRTPIDRAIVRSFE